MEFRKMLMITLNAKQKKRHRCIEQSFRLCGRRRAQNVSREQHRTCILSRVKQITSPGWMHETRARTWCTGKTQRDRVEREVGGGIRMGNTCKPMAVSFQCMTKSTTIKKKKKEKKEKEKKKKRRKFDQFSDLFTATLGFSFLWFLNINYAFCYSKYCGFFSCTILFVHLSLKILMWTQEFYYGIFKHVQK